MTNLSVIINSVAVLFGSVLGIIIGKKIPDAFRDMVFAVLGIVTLLMGIQMGLESNNTMVVLVSLVIGGAIGYPLRLEERIGQLVKRFESDGNESRVAKGFITATLLFVAGPMTILGCFQAGVASNYSIIFLKSALDGISAILLASLYGIGIIFAALSVFLVQGLLVSFSSLLVFLTRPEYLKDFTGVGGVLLIAIGLRMTGIKEIKVGNLLPSIIVVVLVNALLLRLS
jgi:uncharacterized membrane protein YqgA involved in biofilm formation